MATKPKKPRKSKKPAMYGHNSASAEDDAEMLRVAKAQKALDNRRATARAEFKQEQDKLTARLREIGISRKAFMLPYANWLAIQNADDEDGAKQAYEKNVIYLSEQRRAFNALSAGEQIDFVNLLEQAEGINKRKAEEEAAALEEASDDVEDADDNRVEV